MYNKRYKMDSSKLKFTTRFSKPDHPGVDLVPEPRIPGCSLYAICDGIVREAVGPGISPGNFGGADSGFYVAIQAYGNKPDGYLVDKVGHMRDVSVKAGQSIKDGDLIGHEGWTGHVIPASPDGEHTHNAMFHVRNNDYKNMEYIDSTPFLEGKSMIINPVPQEDNNMGYLVFGQKLQYTDRDQLAIHADPNLEKTNVIGQIKPDEICTIDGVVNLPNGMTMGHDGRGWYSLGGPDRYWFKPVESVNNSAELEKLKLDKAALEAQAASLTTERNNNIAEVNRLREIILDGPRRMDP